MEYLTVAGHPEPFPVSKTALELYTQRMVAARAKHGDGGAAEIEDLEKRIGDRITTFLADGTPSIDKATMRAVVDFVDVPEVEGDDEDDGSGFGKFLREIMPGRTGEKYYSIK